MQSQPLLAFKIHEQHADIWIFQQVTHGLKFPVAIVIRESEPLLIQYSHEPRVSTLV